MYLNGEKLPVKAFQDYCDLYLGPKDATGVPRVYERVNDRWGDCVFACIKCARSNVSCLTCVPRVYERVNDRYG